MPVAPVVSSAAEAATAAAASPANAVALARIDPARLPTVSFAEMLGSVGRGPSPEVFAPGTAAAGANADTGWAAPFAPAGGDPWGIGSERPSSATGVGASILDAGERYLGVPYRWGGTDPATGFDCSGFVQQVFADLGVRLPRVSADQARTGVEVGSLQQAQPGDLVFWRGEGQRPNHIGIYAGEGRMLVAPRTGDVVRYQEITRTPDAIRRVVA